VYFTFTRWLMYKVYAYLTVNANPGTISAQVHDCLAIFYLFNNKSPN
jgi:hypothetical protein